MNILQNARNAEYLSCGGGMIPSAPWATHPENGSGALAVLPVPGSAGRTMPHTFATSAGILLRTSETGHLELAPKPPPCMGYANACVCPACRHRQRNPKRAPDQPRQPWEPPGQREAA